MSAKITPIAQHTLYKWDCDDRPDGFVFHVLAAGDGDFHLSIQPSKDNPHRELYSACMNASIRVRMPMYGGGMHKHLWDALAQAIKAEIMESP